MKKFITLIVLLTFAFAIQDALAQKKKASPPATATGEIDGVKITIDYHQPSAKGREIMGDLVPYDEVWRTGANDATTIEVSEDVKIEGKDLPKGKYSLYTIPGEDNWVIIINKTSKQWGTVYNEEEDFLRVEVEADDTDEFVETFNISIGKEDVILSWENTKVSFTISK